MGGAALAAIGHQANDVLEEFSGKYDRKYE
jgi:hypothetical protein